MPGIKILDEDRKNIGEKFFCTVCHLLMIQAMQTSCGHLFCFPCVEELLKNRRAVCPADGYNIVREKEHFTRCPNVRVTCKYCNQPNIPQSSLENHENHECGAEVSCDFKDVGCSKTVKRKELQGHLGNSLIAHVTLLLNFVMGILWEMISAIKAEIVAISQHVRTLEERETSLLESVRGLNTRVENLESGKTEVRTGSRNTTQSDIEKLGREHEKLVEKNRKIENELHDKTLLIERLRTKLEQMDHSMALNAVKLSDLDESKLTQSTISYNGTLLWRIDEFKRKRQDAVNGVQNAIYSPPFYSSQFGYKMCARIYMNGDGFGKGTHISLFFVVMMGEYDALLPWPFQKRITMMLMDQVTGDHMTDAFRSDPDSSSFQRPKTKMNIASGSPLFMPLDSLNNRAYVRDDTMFIKIIID